MNKSLSISALATTFAILLGASPAHAANGNDTWQGSTGSTDWATGGTTGNWATGSINRPPISGDSLIFTSANASSSATLTNTLTTSAFNINGITFNVGAPAYTMTGNTFNLTGAITNNSGVLQTFSNTGGITTVNGLTFNPGTGGISITTGYVNNNTNNTLTVNGGTLTLGGYNVDTSGSRITNIVNGTGNVNITGNITGGDSVDGLTYSGSGTLTIGGGFAFSSNGSSLNVSSGTISLTSAQQGAPVSVTGSGSFNETSAGSILNNGSPTASFTQNSSGTTTLAGSNSYSNTTTVSAGTFNLSGAGTLSGGTAITVSGGAFNESGGAVISAGSTFTTTGGTTTLSGINTYTGATNVNGGTLTLDFSGATTPASAINIIKSGNTVNLGDGTLVVKGGGTGSNAQTFGATALTANTGSSIATNINGGTALNLALGGITRNAQSAVDVTVSTGTGTVTTTTNSSLGGVLVDGNHTAYATANGGTTWLAETGTLSPYALTGLSTYASTYTTATSNVDVANGDAPAAFTVNTLRFNAATDLLTLTGTNILNAGGILVTPTATAASITGSGTLTSGTTGTNAELVIQNYGALNVSAKLVDNGAKVMNLTVAGPGTTTLSGANTLSGNTAIVGTGNLQLGNANALQNSTLIFNPNTATANLTFSSGIGTFTVGGLTGSSNSANILTLTDTGGAGVNLQVGNNNASTTFNGGTNGATGSILTKIGTGTLTLNGGNNITTAFTVNGGSVFSSNISPLQNVPNLTINNGGVVYYSRGSLGIASGAGDIVTINSGGLISSDYISTGSGDAVIGSLFLNGGTVATRNQPTSGTPVLYDRGTFGFGYNTTAGNAAVTAGGGTNPTSTISAVNTRLLESGGTIFNVLAGSGTGGSLSSGGGVDLLFSGTVLSRSNSNNTALIKKGNGVMELTGANSFITPVQINGGILQINSIANGGVATTTNGATSGTASITVASATGIAAGEAVGFNANAGPNAGTTVGSGYTPGSLTVPLAIPTNSTDTGTASVASGVALTFGVANPLGISTNVATNLIIDGGTLQYIGAAGSTDRLFQVGSTVAGGTGTLDASGTGALTFSNTGSIGYGTTNQTRTLGLTGTSTAANTLAPSIANNGTGAVSVTKTGTGTWVLTGANSFTGGATISGGTLLTGSTSALGATTDAVAVNGGATLDLDGNSQTVGGLTLGTGGSTIADSAAAATLTTSGVMVSGISNTINTGVTVSGNTTQSAASALAVNGAITGTDSLAAGATALSGTGSVSGVVTLNGGGNTVSSSSTLATGGVSVNGSGNTITGGIVSGGGTINGGGTLGVNAGATLSGALNVSNGGTLTGQGTVGATTVSGGGAINLTDNAIGTLHTGSITIGAAGTPSALTFEVNTVSGITSADSIADVGNLTFGGANGTTITIGNVTGNSTLTNGTYNLITYTGTLTGFSNLTLSTTSLDGKVLSLINAAGVIELNVASSTTGTTYTLTTTAGSTLLHAGATTGLTTTITNTGTGTADALNYTGLTASSSSGNGIAPGAQSGGPLANNGGTASNAQTYTATNSGTDTISANGSGTNATLATGATQTSATGTTITVYSGMSTWTTNGSGTWGTAPTATPANWTASGGTPGVTAGFTGVDTATFGAQTATAITVGLNGAAPNLNAITFSSPSTAYTLAQNYAGGTGTSSITLSGTTPSINVTNPGSSLTAGTQTISAPLILGATTSLNVAANQKLNISGQISSAGTFGLTNSGPGITTLTSDTGNTYTGPTTITGGTVFIKNTSGSATGTGAVTVSGSSTVLKGHGEIDGAVTLSGGATLFSGSTSAGTGPGTGMKLTSALAVNGAALTFQLSNGTNSATYANPNTTTSYLDLGTTGTVSFSGLDTINLVDLSNGGLTLRLQSPYLLISGSSSSVFYGLVIRTSSGAVGLSQDGFQGSVLGVWTGTGDDYKEFTFNQYGSDGTTPLAPTDAGNTTGAYISPFLYLSGGNLEVVPEPGTWALMIGGLALLIVIQRRKHRSN